MSVGTQNYDCIFGCCGIHSIQTLTYFLHAIIHLTVFYENVSGNTLVAQLVTWMSVHCVVCILGRRLGLNRIPAAPPVAVITERHRC